MDYLSNLRSRTARTSLASVYNSTTETTDTIVSYKVLSKLIDCFVPFDHNPSRETTEFKEDLLKHYDQILTSQKESSIIPDENSILIKIHALQKKHFSLVTFITNCLH